MTKENKCQCPICESACTCTEIEDVNNLYKCPRCTFFFLHNDIGLDQLSDLLKEKDRQKISRGIKLHYEKYGKPVLIVLEHREKTLKQLEEEGA
jgi:hypothetical protein